jgi:hypothetical protein
MPISFVIAIDHGHDRVEATFLICVDLEGVQSREGTCTWLDQAELCLARRAPWYTGVTVTSVTSEDPVAYTLGEAARAANKLVAISLKSCAR